MKRAFTLMELLIVIAIIGILASVGFVALSAAVNQARVAHTRSSVDRIDSLIMERWENYRTRPMRIGTTANAQAAARLRLYHLRETQRLELPDRISDLCTQTELTELQANASLAPTSMNVTDAYRHFVAMPAVTKSIKRMAQKVQRNLPPNTPWSTVHQSAECLYLILATMKDGDKSALEFFTPDEIGDIDQDGRLEILDGFGNPIEFLRWTPGYTKEQQAVTEQSENIEIPDPFDPLKAALADGVQTYAIRPLIMSGGLDKQLDVNFGSIIYAHPGFPTAMPPGTVVNDPYPPTTVPIGQPFDTNNDGTEQWADNITNHYREPQ